MNNMLGILVVAFATGITDEPSQRLDALELAVAELQVTAWWIQRVFAGSILAFSLGLFGVWKVFRGMVVKTIEKKWRTERAVIRDMIAAADLDHRILRDTEILAVSIEPDHEAGALLLRSGFHRVADALWQNEIQDDLFRAGRDADLVLLDQASAGQVDLWVSRCPDTIFVVYAQGHLTVADQSRVVFANTPLTLLSRTMEAARYRKLSSG